MKKKCGILTITVNSMNYGNRLQNYALLKVLQKLGTSVATINYTPSYDYSLTMQTKYETTKKKYNIVKMLNTKIFHFRNLKQYKLKTEKFNQFIEKRLEFDEVRIFSDSDFSYLEKQYDYIVAGSDQIWNPYWEGSNDIYFLDFIPKSRGIVYSASFGIGRIPDFAVDRYKNRIRNLEKISCREDVGCEIIKNLTGRNVMQVLDPSFLLDKEEWFKIECRPHMKQKEDKYILVYFLGKISQDTQRKINYISNIVGCKCIYLDSSNKYHSIFASPEEFLYLVHNAKLVLTDSFHGTAFSIIFERPFIIFNRHIENGSLQDMSSRLDSLVRLFHCEERFINRISECDYLLMEYESINQILKDNKKKSMKFISDSLQS